MNNRITGYIMAGVLMMIWGGIGEMSTMSAAQMVKINALMTMPVIKDASFIGIISNWVTFGANWLDTLWHILWMQFGFYQGEFSIFILIFWIPVAIGIIYGIACYFRGTSA